MDSAYALLSGNLAKVTLPSGVSISLKAKSNSSALQRITINDGSQDILAFTGSGEGNSIIGQGTLTDKTQLTIKFEFQQGGQWKGSVLNSGGPYVIGTYNMLIVVAENGDDSDYNDSILEFTWYTKK